MDRKGKKPSICNCLNLRRASLAITKIYDEKLQPSGLSVSQYAIIKHLYHLGTVSVSDLSASIRLDRTTLVRSLKPLESNGLITDISENGTRNRQLQLTERGLSKYQEAAELWDEAQQYIEQNLGKENIEKLTALLCLIENL